MAVELKPYQGDQANDLEWQERLHDLTRPPTDLTMLFG
jgi:hypothetical protein